MYTQANILKHSRTYIFPLILIRLCRATSHPGAQTNFPDEEFVGLDSTPAWGVGLQLTQLFFTPEPKEYLGPVVTLPLGRSINGYLAKPEETKLWYPGCHTDSVSGKGFSPTTGSKGHGDRDKHRRHA